MFTADEENVNVVIEGETVPGHTEFFQCCHLGLVFFSAKPVELYKQMKFNLSLAAQEAGKVNVDCTGVVVESKFEEDLGMYKTFFIYTDIDKQTQERLKYISREKALVCPYCMNF